MALGFHQAGIEVLYSFDYNEKAVATFNANLPSVCEQRDAREVTVDELLERTGINVGELDIFSGGPPCQGFSKQKRGDYLFDDPRNLLMKDYLRLVSGLKPKTFVLENVAIFGQKRGKPYLDELSATLTDYILYPHFYNSADYGIAQTRERFILVGIRRDINVVFEVPKPEFRGHWRTVGEVLAELPEPPEDCTPHPQIPNHYKANISKENEHRISFVPQGGGWQDIPWKYRLDCHKGADPKSGGWPDVYGRLSMDGQCPTITGGFDNFSRGRYAHPIENRAITPREAARLQGFPDNYFFHGNRGDVRLQIGNAVPPPLARAIGSEIVNLLDTERHRVVHKSDNNKEVAA